MPGNCGHPLNQTPDLDASEICLDPYKSLAAAVLKNAVKDLKSSKVAVSLDALFWWIDESSFWLEALGFDSLDDKHLVKLLEA